MPSKFVRTNPGDPEAPRVLAEYVTNPTGYLLTPGAVVTYVNPAMPGLGNPTPEGGPMEVAELILYPDAERPYVAAILDGGAYECSADNLVPVEAVREEPGGAWVESSPAARAAWARRAAGLSDAAVEAEAEADAAGQRGAVAAALAEALGTDPAHVVLAGSLRAAANLGVRPLDSPGASPQPVARDNAEAPGAEPANRALANVLANPRLAALAAAELPGEWPNLSVCTAAAFAAYEAIQSGEWDPYLPILAGAIRARRAAVGFAAVRAAGGDPDDPDNPAWAEAGRAWRPPPRRPR